MERLFLPRTKKKTILVALVLIGAFCVVDRILKDSPTLRLFGKVRFNDRVTKIKPRVVFITDEVDTKTGSQLIPGNNPQRQEEDYFFKVISPTKMRVTLTDEGHKNSTENKAAQLDVEHSEWMITRENAGASMFRMGPHVLKITKPPLLDPEYVINGYERTFPKVGAINCKVLEGNGSVRMDEWNRANAYMAQNPKNVESIEHFSKDTLDCVAFKEKRGYVTSSITQEEKDFPIAFSLLLYKDIAQAERLLRAIYRPQNYYCIHLDSKSSRIHLDAITAIASCFDNVFMTSRMVPVQWGWFSVVEPELICMEELWKYKKWKYFINLTGQEFPLKTNWELVRILKAYNGANGIGGTIKGRRAMRTQVVHHGIYSTKTKKEPFEVNVTLTKGPAHVVASRGFVDFVLHDERALKFREWVKDTGVPDETFFSTLNHNPQWGVPGSFKGEPEMDHDKYPYLTRFKSWKKGMFFVPCAGKRVRAICIFGVGDLNTLTSRPELFVNKFDYYFEPLGYDCLEEWHFRKTIEEYQGKRFFNPSFYANLAMVDNKV